MSVIYFLYMPYLFLNVDCYYEQYFNEVPLILRTLVFYLIFVTKFKKSLHILVLPLELDIKKLNIINHLFFHPKICLSWLIDISPFCISFNTKMPFLKIIKLTTSLWFSNIFSLAAADKTKYQSKTRQDIYLVFVHLPIKLLINSKINYNFYFRGLFAYII